MRHILPLVLALLAIAPAYAQKQVYKCTANGKVEYSHAPCIGAQEIDTTPTRGVDKLSGSSRKGRDIQKREMDEAFADAFKPVTGMERDEFLKASERTKLPVQAQQECRKLDAVLPSQKAELKTATGDAKTQAELRLYQTRKRYYDLNC